MTELTDDGTDGPTDDALRALLDAEHHRARVEERRRRHWLRRQAEAVPSVAGTLEALVADRVHAEVVTPAGVTRFGTAFELGTDYVALRCDSGTVRFLALGSVAAVGAADRTSPTGSPSMAPEHRTSLLERLGELIGVSIAIVGPTGAELAVGTLRAVGPDSLLLATDRGPAVVAVAVVAEVAAST